MQWCGARSLQTRGFWRRAVGITICIVGALACGACGEQPGEREQAPSAAHEIAKPVADQAADNLLTNATLEFNNATPDADAIVEGWRFYAGEPGLLEQAETGGVVLDSRGSTRARYQDVAMTATPDGDADGTPADSLGFEFTCRFRAEPGPANSTLA